MAGIVTAVGDLGGAGSAGSSGGMEADLGATLREGFDLATVSDDAPEPEPSGDEPGSDPGSVDPGLPIEEPVEELEAPVDPAGADASDSPWPVSEDGKTVLMPRGELARVTSALTFAEQVGQIFPSAQDAVTSAGQASDLRQITNDWLHGSDDAIQSFMNHWLGANHRDPVVRASCQRSFGRMLGMAIPALQKLDPATHASLSGGILKDHVSGMYARAAEVAGAYGPESDAAKQALLNAQSIDWGMNGTYQKELPRVDPAAAERAKFEAQRAEFETRQASALRRDVQDFNTTAVEGSKFKQLDAEIEKALGEKVRARYSDVAYADLKAGISREIQSVLGARGDWFTEHRQTFDALIRDYQTTWKNGSPGAGLQPRVAAYIGSYLREAKRVLPAIAAKRITATTRSQASSSSARPAGQNGASTARASRPSNSPSTSGSNGSPRRLNSDEWNAELAKALRG